MVSTSPPKDTFASFEAKYESTTFSPPDLAALLKVSSQDYAVICGEEKDKSESVTTELAGLNALDSATTYPVLLALFRQRAAGVLDDDQLALAIRMLRGFILRRFICGESSRGYGQMFVRVLGKSDEPVKALETYLLERGWPDDHQFETAFAVFPLYQRGYTRQVLEALERARGHKEPADLSAAQVEHVMPQTLNDAWRQMLGQQADRIYADCLHRPGNLTLSAYNQELWNHPFDKKCKRYAESNIVLTRELADNDTWGETKINERGLQLAKETAQIWIGPKDPIPQTVEVGEGMVGRRELRLEFWTGLSEYLAAEHPQIPHFEPRPSWSIRLSSGIRHIGFEIRLGLRQKNVGIDVWFWRAASFPLWDRIRTAPETYNVATGASWGFEPLEGRERARMFLDRFAEDLRDESTWPQLYKWFGDYLVLLYGTIAPKLRADLDHIE